ncbi:MAG: MoaD/ThiS family protein [Flavitalea sp.]
MQATIKMFGKLTEITSASSVMIDDVKDTDEVISILQQRYPGLMQLQYIIAVDKEIIHNNTILTDHSIIALLPPYSGG